jgi:polar amino acid transport system substrate-binding protein
MLKSLLLAGFCLLYSLCVEAAAPPRKITLVTQEFVPYMSTDLPDQGAAVYALRKVFASMNCELKVIFVSSWERAKYLALTDATVDGYFPNITEENKSIFSFSETISEGEWGVAERRDHPIHWKKLAGLGKYVGGNAVGIELRPGIKELVEQKKLNIETAPDDVSNLQKLAKLRVDYIFINPVAFTYLLATNPLVHPFRDQLRINPKLIAKDKYGIALRKARFPNDFMANFNQAARGNVDKYARDYLERALSKTRLK